MELFVGNLGNELGAPIYLSANDLKAHAHGVGASRAGKSKLIEHIARQMVRSRRGFCLIDPGGFLYQDLVRWLAYVSPTRSDVVLIDPSYERKVVGFNPFRLDGPKTEASIAAKVDRLVALTTKALGIPDFASAPRLERVMRCLYYVLIEQGLSLEAVTYFLSPRHIHVRDTIIGRIESETIKDQWLMLTQGRRPESYLNLVESTANRLFKVLAQPSVKRIFGVPENSIDINAIMTNRSGLLINLQPSLSFSQDAARIFGAFLVNEIWESVRRRTRDEMQRSPNFYLLVDEFQSFTTPDFPQMLDQGAKYGLHLILFHQNLNQLDNATRTALTACHTRFVFGGITSNDAGLMLEGSRPTFDNLRDDVALVPSLPARHYLLKRPDKPLAFAHTPEVREFKVPISKVEAYVETATESFLSPDNLDRLMKMSVPLPDDTQAGPGLASHIDLAQPPVGDDQLLNETTPPPPRSSAKGFELTYERARGTRTHADSQLQIASVARELGFKAQIEKPVLDGAGVVDVSIEKSGIRIACEVSITTTAAWEVKNVLKCLRAGYDRVWVVAFPKNVPGLSTRIRASIPNFEQAKLKVMTLGDCFVELQKLASPPDSKPAKAAKVNEQWLSVGETAAFFSVNTSTVYRWKSEGRLPFRQVGRKILFDRELLALLGRHNLTGTKRSAVNLDAPVKIEKPKPRTKKQAEDRYRKLLGLD